MLLAAIENSPDALWTSGEYANPCWHSRITRCTTPTSTAPECGFSWYQMPKFEHQLVSLRHIHHHTGQLVDRLRHATGQGSPWTKGAPV